MRTRRTAVTIAAVLVLVSTAVAEAQWAFGADGGPAGGPGADFDGDGYDDLAIGAPDEDVDTTMDAGAVSVVYGGPTGAGSNGSAILRPGVGGVAGTAQRFARFGEQMATGDFDGDGYDDLAVAAPGQSYGRDVPAAGSVTVVHGSASGLGARSGLFRQGRAPLAGRPEAYDAFGSALAAGDLDGDGFDDLAVGVPAQDGRDVTDAGEVDVLFGGPSGLGARVVLLARGRHGVPGSATWYGSFGLALGIGDLDGDGRGDLAVGDLTDFVGAVTIVPGAAGGLDGAAARSIGAGDVPCRCPQIGLSFGSALAAGDLDGDGYADLAVGASGWEDGWAADAGNVSVVFGTPDRSDPAATYDQATFGTLPEEGDYFGATVAIGDLDGDGAAELVVGAPNEDVGAVADAGIVVVVSGAAAAFPGPATVRHQGHLGGRYECGDRFGASVGLGDVTGDGRLDLVVGAPAEDVGSTVDAGNVTVVDSANGVRAFDQSATGGWLEADDRFANSIA